MNRRGILVVTLVCVIAILSVMPAEGAITYGRWRNINATQYAPDAAGSLRGVFVRDGGSGAIGAGDGWAVGGSTSSLILHYDGFSWHTTASPNATATYYNSANFCTTPGAPGVGLCSPNGDGSDGWIVGYGSKGGIALYWDGSALTSSAAVPDANNLTSVFLESHNDLSSTTRGVAVAVGENSTHATLGSGGAIWQITGTPYGQLIGGWTEQTITPGSAMTDRYNSVYMFNTGSAIGGFAVGNGGVIAQLQPGGWIATKPATVDLLSVFVDQANPVDAWAVGRAGTICHYGPGTSFVWQCSTPASGVPVTTDLYGIFLLSSNEAWVVGSGSTILHYTNLPTLTSPSTIVAPTGTAINLFGESFPSGGNGWIVGSNGAILQTGNSECPGVSSPCWGGSTSVTQSKSLNATFELSGSDAWAGGTFDPSYPASSTTLIHWDGNRWSRPTVSVSSGQWDVLGIYMTGSSDGWAVGSNDDGSGNTLDTFPLALHWDGGTWTQGPVGGLAACGLRSVYMINGGDGWAVGTGGNIFHYGGGMNWGGAFYTLASGKTLRGVFINNPSSSTPPAGWAVGDTGTVVQLQVLSGNYVWSSAGTLNGVISDLYGVFFKDSQHGWIVGASATILTTTNGGLSWSGGTGQVVGAPANTILRSVFIDTLGTGSGNGDGWAVGDDGSGNTMMAHWDGATWTVVPLSPPPTSSAIALNSVYLTGPEDGFAVGSNIPSITGSLSAIFHLDPLNPPTVVYATTTTTAATSSSSTATSTVTGSSTISATSQVGTVTTASAATTTEISTSVSTSLVSTTAVVTQTVTTSSSSTTTPLVLPAIPGFPWESIIAGIVIGIALLGITRRNKRKTT